jgi:hypothetical protein
MFLIALALSVASEPDRWVPVAGSAGPAEYLDRDSLRRSGDKVTLWTRRDERPGQATAWRELELDCAKRTHTLLAWVRDDAGTVTHNGDHPAAPASLISSGSVESTIFKLACR